MVVADGLKSERYTYVGCVAGGGLMVRSRGLARTDDSRFVEVLFCCAYLFFLYSRVCL